MKSALRIVSSSCLTLTMLLATGREARAQQDAAVKQLLSQAQRLYASGQAEPACEKYRKALALKPDLPGLSGLVERRCPPKPIVTPSRPAPRPPAPAPQKTVVVAKPPPAPRPPAPAPQKMVVSVEPQSTPRPPEDPPRAAAVKSEASSVQPPARQEVWEVPAATAATPSGDNSPADVILSSNVQGALVNELAGYPNGLTIGPETTTVRQPRGVRELTIRHPDFGTLHRTIELRPPAPALLSIDWRPLLSPQDALLGEWDRFVSSGRTRAAYLYSRGRRFKGTLATSVLTTVVGIAIVGAGAAALEGKWGLSSDSQVQVGVPLCLGGSAILITAVTLMSIEIHKATRMMPRSGQDMGGNPAIQQPAF